MEVISLCREGVQSEKKTWGVVKAMFQILLLPEKYTQAFRLKGTMVIYFAHESATWAGLSGDSLFLLDVFSDGAT